MRNKLAIIMTAVVVAASSLGCGISDEVKEHAQANSQTEENSDATSEEENSGQTGMKPEFEFFTGYGTVSEEHWFDISYVESAEVVASSEEAAKVSPYSIIVYFTEEGTKELSGYTEDLLGRDMYLRIDNTVMALVQIQEYMLADYGEGKFTIVDEFITTQEQAQKVVDQINAKLEAK